MVTQGSKAVPEGPRVAFGHPELFAGAHNIDSCEMSAALRLRRPFKHHGGWRVQENLSQEAEGLEPFYETAMHFQQLAQTLCLTKIGGDLAA